MKTMILILAALLSPGIHAQNAKPETSDGQQSGQPAPSTSSVADDPQFKQLSPERQAFVKGTLQQIDAAIAQRDLIALERVKLDVAHRELLGSKFCGDHTVDDRTFLDAAEHSPVQEAYAVRWLDREPGKTAHTAIFTQSGRCVAMDGAVMVTGQIIAAVMPNSLAVSVKAGMVAYEAEYWSSAADQAKGAQPTRGIFIENSFLANLDPQIASAPFRLNGGVEDADFHWNGQTETLELKPGVAWRPAPQPATFTPRAKDPAQTQPTSPEAASGQPQSGCAEAKQAQSKRGIGGIRLPGALGKVLQKAQTGCPEYGQGAKH